MADLAQLIAWRDALLEARAAGVRSVSSGDTETTFGSDRDMAAAIADLERRIAIAEGRRVTDVRISSNKGV